MPALIALQRRVDAQNRIAERRHGPGKDLQKVRRAIGRLAVRVNARIVPRAPHTEFAVSLLDAVDAVAHRNQLLDVFVGEKNGHVHSWRTPSARLPP
jgi:hypothetical protein